MAIKKKLYAAFPLLARMAAHRNALIYQLSGRKPWTRGYFEHKWESIGRAIGDKSILAAFAQGAPLPTGFGRRLDERIVEYPWMLAHLPKGPAILLDAGSALNFDTILTQPALAGKSVTIVNLNPEPNCFWRRGVSYLFGDIRALPFKDGSFDLVTCISTLEHVGMDNTAIYTADPRYREERTGDYLEALAELKRVLKPGGTALVTVPFGVHRNHGFFQQFDRGMVERALALFGGASGATYYRYADDGWQISTAEACAGAEYVEAKDARQNTSSAAAASAVACLTLTK